MSNVENLQVQENEFSRKRYSHLPSLKFIEMGTLLALLFLVCVFTLISPNFFTLETWGSLLTASTEIGLIALGMTFVMTCGDIDLSVGSIFACTGVLFAQANLVWGFSPLFSFLLALLLGAGIGFLNGWLTISTKLPSFIISLGSMLFWQGAVLVFTKGFPIADVEEKAGFSWLSKEIAYGFRWSVFIWFALAFLLYCVLKKQTFGNWVFATGGNRDAAFSMGIRTSRVRIVCFTITGVLTAFSAIIHFTRLESMSPLSGDQYALKAIAIAVMGGTLLTGGRGTILGTVLGTLIMGVLTTGLVQAGISNYWFRAFIGMIIIAAVVFNGRLQKIFKV